MEKSIGYVLIHGAQIGEKMDSLELSKVNVILMLLCGPVVQTCQRVSQNERQLLTIGLINFIHLKRIIS